MDETFHEAGIQTHMLDRALNGLRMSPVPADVRRLFYKVKKAQGTDITRTFLRAERHPQHRTQHPLRQGSPA